jgi:hypothetical protein
MWKRIKGRHSHRCGYRDFLDSSQITDVKAEASESGKAKLEVPAIAYPELQVAPVDSGLEALTGSDGRPEADAAA